MQAVILLRKDAQEHDYSVIGSPFPSLAAAKLFLHETILLPTSSKIVLKKEERSGLIWSAISDTVFKQELVADGMIHKFLVPHCTYSIVPVSWKFLNDTVGFVNQHLQASASTMKKAEATIEDALFTVSLDEPPPLETDSLLSASITDGIRA